jgi:hypothetical protein
MKHVENNSRRNLIKWMTLASTPMWRPVSLLADVAPGQTAYAGARVTVAPGLISARAEARIVNVT